MKLIPSTDARLLRLVLLFFIYIQISSGLTAQTSVKLSVASKEVACGATDTAFVYISKIDKVAGVSFTLEWNPSELEYKGNIPTFFSQPGFNIDEVANGRLTYSWFSSSPSPPSVTTDSVTILKVSFLVLKSTTANRLVRLTDKITPLEVTFINNSNRTEFITPTTRNGVFKIVDTTKPAIICPASNTLTAPANATTLNVEGIDALSTDNCGVASVAYTLSGATVRTGANTASQTSFNIGQTNVKYTVTDNAGNTNACSFNITVNSSIITATGDTLVLKLANAQPNCGTTVDLPLTVERFSNIANFSFKINILNNTKLQYQGVTNKAFSNINVTENSGILTVSWTDAANTAQTLVDGSKLFDIQLKALGTSSLTFFSNTAQSKVGNTTTDLTVKTTNGQVSVSDNEKPTVSCPSSQIVQTNSTATTAVVQGLNATINDNCGTPTIGYNLSGATTATGGGQVGSTPFNVGTTTVTYLVSDAASNTASCTFSITVQSLPTQDLTIKVPTQDVECGKGFSIPIKVDNFTDLVGLQFSINWDATKFRYDSVSNFISTLALSKSVNFGETNKANGQISFSWFSGTAISLAADATLFNVYLTPLNGATGATVFITSTPVVIEATQKGNPAKQVTANVQNGTLSVKDTQKPMLTCPSNINVSNFSSNSSNIVNVPAPTVVENCGVASLAYSLSGATTATGTSLTNGVAFNSGTTTMTFTATDFAGNTGTCSFAVSLKKLTIIPSADTTNCNSNEKVAIHITANDFIKMQSLQFATKWDKLQLRFDSVSNFNSTLGLSFGNFGFANIGDGALNFSWLRQIANSTDTSGTNLNNGARLFTLYFTPIGQVGTSTVSIGDNGALVVEAVMAGQTTQVIPVETRSSSVYIVDTKKPTITNCPQDISLTASGANCNAIVTWTAPTVTDECSSFVNTASNFRPGDAFPIGVHTVTYKATDSSGNEATCSFKVTVSQVSNVVINTCPSDVTVYIPKDKCTIQANWTAPTAATVCGGTAQLSVDKLPNNFEFPVGENVVTYTATDGLGARATCSFKVIVRDTIKPTITNCPESIEKLALADSCGVRVYWTAILATKFCETSVNLTTSKPSGTYFPVGKDSVMVTARDRVGNTSTCKFFVTVLDKTAPKVTGCPKDTTFEANATTCATANVSWKEPVFTDICDNNLTVAKTHSPNTAFAKGVTKVSYMAMDYSGNKTTCEFNVTVTSPKPAIKNCPKDTVINLTAANCSTTYSWVVPTAEGLCGATIASLTSDVQSGATFQTGVKTITYTAKDNANNTATCSFKVTVKETKAPVLTCPESIIVNTLGKVISDGSKLIKTAKAVSACAGVELTFGTPTATDECSTNVTVAQTEGTTSGGIFPVGTSTITFRATDASGNTSTCKVNIIVQNATVTAYNLTNTICRGTELKLTTDTIATATYAWTGPNGYTSTAQSPTISSVGLTHIGQYQVTTTLNGCSIKSSPLNVQLFVGTVTPVKDNFVTDDLTAISGDVILNDNLPTGVKYTVTIMQNVSTGLLTMNEQGKFTYTPTEGSTGQINFIYKVCLAGCSDACGDGVATIIVNPNTVNCKVPTAITPNGDENNDKLIISCLEQSKKKSSIIIFNEWGQRVFTASPYGPTNWWDGTYKGQPLPDGTYFYIFTQDVDDPNSFVKKGYLTIIR